MKLKKNINVKIENSPVHYDEAILLMESHVKKMRLMKAEELLWFLEHKNIFTAGTSAKKEDQSILDHSLIRYTGRGGQWTWHGIGQRIIYTMIDLNIREKDLKKFIKNIQNWLILSLNEIDINCCILEKHPGVWIKKGSRYYKIASVGIRISNWITWHGVSINVNPDLSYFNQINPCGFKDGLVTSIHQEGKKITNSKFDKILIKNFYKFF